MQVLGRGNHRWIFLFGLPLLFLALGHCFVLQRHDHAMKHELTIRGDTLEYIKMIQGDYTHTRPPFKHRVMVPLLAGALPWSPLTSLRVITYASLYLAYLLVLVMNQQLGLESDRVGDRFISGVQFTAESLPFPQSLSHRWICGHDFHVGTIRCGSRLPADIRLCFIAGGAWT